MEKTILVFSADLQKETPHTIDVDGNGEIILTCTETGRSLKFPAGTNAEQLKELLIRHKEANMGQRTKESIEIEKAAIIDALVPQS